MLKPEKLNFWGHFWNILGPSDSTGLLFKYQASSFFLLSGHLTSGKKNPRKFISETLPCKRTERRTEPNSEDTSAEACAQQNNLCPSFISCDFAILNPLSANFTKWSNTLKQFVGKLPTNCLSVFDHFAGLALKGLKNV